MGSWSRWRNPLPSCQNRDSIPWRSLCRPFEGTLGSLPTDGRATAIWKRKRYWERAAFIFHLPDNGSVSQFPRLQKIGVGCVPDAKWRGLLVTLSRHGWRPGMETRSDNGAPMLGRWAYFTIAKEFSYPQSVAKSYFKLQLQANPNSPWTVLRCFPAPAWAATGLVLIFLLQGCHELANATAATATAAAADAASADAALGDAQSADAQSAAATAHAAGLI